MRLGAYACKLAEGSTAYAVYGRKDISERHRHRYEFNNAYLERLPEGWHGGHGHQPAEGKLVEIVEVKDHPWFVGVQFHPEYRSTVMKPHALFVALRAGGGEGRSACG
jgi:CTP synthase